MSDIITIVQICSEADFGTNKSNIYFREFTTNVPLENISDVELEAWVRDDFYYDTVLFARAKHVSTTSQSSDWSYIRQFQIRGSKWYLEHAGLIKRWDSSKISNITLREDNRKQIASFKCSITDENLISTPSNNNKTYPTYKYPGICFYDNGVANPFSFTGVKAKAVALVIKSTGTNPGYSGNLIGGYDKDGNVLGLNVNDKGDRLNTNPNHKSITPSNNGARYFINGKLTSDPFGLNKITIIVVNLYQLLDGFTFDKIGPFMQIDGKFLFPYNGIIYDVCLFDKQLSPPLVKKVSGVLLHQWKKIFPNETIESYFPDDFPYKTVLPENSDEWDPGCISGDIFALDIDKSNTYPPDVLTKYPHIFDSIDIYTQIRSDNYTPNNPDIIIGETGKSLVLANKKNLQWNITKNQRYNGPRTIVLVEKGCEIEKGGGLFGLPNSDNTVDSSNVLFTNKDGSMYPYPSLPFKSGDWRIHLVHQRGSTANPGIREQSFIRLNGGDKILLPDLPDSDIKGIGNKIVLCKTGEPTTQGNYTATSGNIAFVLIYFGELSDSIHDMIIGWVARSKNLTRLLPDDFKYKNASVTHPLITKTPSDSTLCERELLSENEFTIDINVNEERVITGNLFKEENQKKLIISSVFNDPLLLDTNVNLSDGGIVKLSSNGDYTLTFDNLIQRIQPGAPTVDSYTYILVKDIESLLEQVYIVKFRFTRTDISQSIIDRIISNLTKSVSNDKTVTLVPFEGLGDYKYWLTIDSMNDLPYPRFNDHEGKLYDSNFGYYKYYTTGIHGPELIFDPTRSSVYSKMNITDAPLISRVKMTIKGRLITKDLHFEVSVSKTDITNGQKFDIRNNCIAFIGYGQPEYTINILSRAGLSIGEVFKFANEIVSDTGIIKTIRNLFKITMKKDSTYTLTPLPGLAELEPSSSVLTEEMPIEFVFPNTSNPRVTFITRFEIRYMRSKLTPEEEAAFIRINSIDFSFPNNTEVNILAGIPYPWARIRRINTAEIPANSDPVIYRDPNGGEFSISPNGMIKVLSYPGLVGDQKVYTVIPLTFGSIHHNSLHSRSLDVSVRNSTTP